MVARFFGYLFISIFFLFPFHVFSQTTRNPSRTIHNPAANVFKEGGVVENWIFMMPSPVDQTNGAGEKKSGVIYRDRLIDESYFDSLGRFVSSASEKNGVVSEKIQADSAWWLRPQDRTSYPFYYAYAQLEAHVTEEVRLFIMGRGVFRAWFNGVLLTGGMGSIVSDDAAFFDTVIKQGDNRLLILFLPDGADSLLVEMHPIKKGLVPFEKKIDSVNVSRELVTNDSVIVRPYFNLTVPPGGYHFNAIISTDSDSAGAVFSTITGINPDSLVTINFPPNYVGVIRLRLESTLSNGTIVKKDEYFWSGELPRAYLKEKEQSRLLEQKIAETPLKRQLNAALAKGFFSWSGQLNFDTLSLLQPTESQIREIGYLASGNSIFEKTLKTGRLQKRGAFPVAIHCAPNFPLPEDHYDPSGWLSYKYPDLYWKPKNGCDSLLNVWVRLPDDAGKIFGKHDLTVYFHDLMEGEHTFSTVRQSGLLNYAEKGGGVNGIIALPYNANAQLWSVEQTNALINFFKPKIVTNRLFLTGEGAGGFAVWNLLTLIPEQINAAVPINAFGSTDHLCQIGDVPLWIFHGNLNTTVPVENAHKTLLTLKGCRKKGVGFSIYSENGHDIESIVFHDPDSYRWLYRQ